MKRILSVSRLCLIPTQERGNQLNVENLGLPEFLSIFYLNKRRGVLNTPLGAKYGQHRKSAKEPLMN
jgi:hypothetical protein